MEWLVFGLGLAGFAGLVGLVFLIVVGACQDAARGDEGRGR